MATTTLGTVPFHFQVSEIAITPASGVDTPAYVTRTLHGSFAGSGAEAPPLDLIAKETVLAAAPAEQRALLAARLDGLDTRMLEFYPAPDGEQLASTSAAILRSATGRSPAGSVVWVRTTNAAVVRFVLPNIRFDAAAGSYEYLPLPASEPPKAVSAAAQQQVEMVLDLVDICAVALPEPFGTVIGATTSLFELLFGKGEDEDVVQDTVDQLEAYERNQVLAQWASQIYAQAFWLNTEVQTLIQTTGADSTYVAKVLRELDASLDQAQASSLYSIVMKLSDGKNYPYLDPASSQYEPSALGLWQQAMALLFVFYKARVQLGAVLAANNFGAGNIEQFDPSCHLWVDNCINWDTVSRNLMSRCDTLLDACTKSWTSSSVFTALYRYDAWSEPTNCHKSGYDVVCNYIQHPGGYAADEFPHTSREVKNVVHVDDTTKGSGCNSETVKHKDTAQAQLDALIQAAQAPYQAARKALDTWAAIPKQQWLPLLPPSAPTAAPEITQWTEAIHGADHGINWVNGAKVRYAVGFQSDDGPSPLGPWCAWATVTDKCFPQMSIPCAPADKTRTHQVAKRLIFRQFDGAKAHLLAEVADNTTPVFTDTQP